jgi:hypothetical protein
MRLNTSADHGRWDVMLGFGLSRSYARFRPRTSHFHSLEAMLLPCFGKLEAVSCTILSLIYWYDGRFRAEFKSFLSSRRASPSQ